MPLEKTMVHMGAGFRAAGGDRRVNLEQPPGFRL